MIRRHAVIPGSALEAFTYYVDSVNGNDSNDGLSRDTALATLGALPSLTTGQSVGLARGSSWDEMLTIAADNVTVADYGSGAKPIIDCSDVITGWTEHVSEANVWQKTVATDYGSGDPVWINVFQDGAFLTYRSSVALVNSNAGSYTVSSHTSATPIIYIHPTGTTDPNTDGREYRVTVRQCSIFADGYDQIRIRNIVTRRNYRDSGSILADKYAVLSGVECNQGNKHNALIGDGSLVQDCVFTDAYYNAQSASLLVVYTNAGTTLGATVSGCTFTETSDTGVDGFYCHVGSSGDIGAVTVSNCTMTGIKQGVTGVNLTSMTVSGCTITNNTGAAIRIEDNVPYTISNCTISTTGTGTVSFVTTSTGAASGTVITITDCSATTASSTSGIVSIQHSDVDCTLTNTTLNMTAPAGDFTVSGVFIQSARTGIDLVMNGCELTGMGQNMRLLSTPNSYTADNNCFTTWHGAFSGRYGATTYNTIANWRTATSQDANSTYGC